MDKIRTACAQGVEVFGRQSLCPMAARRRALARVNERAREGSECATHWMAANGHLRYVVEG
eukprot:6188435-Pleurochrysis_carterae.AAC.1